jgi:hypothetical protein
MFLNKFLSICKRDFSFGKLAFYMFRWQLSTPILGFITYLFSGRIDSMLSAAIANIAGSLIFFWIDLYTFSKKE